MEETSLKTILTPGELDFLRELTREKIKFLLVGLSAATLQGAPVATQDVDLWFKELSDPRIAQIARKTGGTYIPPIPTIQNPPKIVGPQFHFLDLVTTLSGIDNFDEEYSRAYEVKIADVTLKLLPLERIIHSKTVANRPKDKAVLPVLKDTLKVLQKK